MRAGTTSEAGSSALPLLPPSLPPSLSRKPHCNSDCRPAQQAAAMEPVNNGVFARMLRLPWINPTGTGVISVTKTAPPPPTAGLLGWGLPACILPGRTKPAPQKSIASPTPSSQSLPHHLGPAVITPLLSSPVPPYPHPKCSERHFANPPASAVLSLLAESLRYVHLVCRFPSDARPTSQ